MDFIVSGFKFQVSLPPPPRCQSVRPAYADAEPAEARHFLTSETENEVAVGILAEGQTDINETEVLHAFLVGVFDSIPDGHSIGV